MDAKPAALVKYVFDYDAWPVAVAITPKDVPSHEIDVESFYAQLEGVMQRRKRFASVQDLSGASPFDPKRRQRFAKFLADRGEDIKRYIVCNAVVVDSPVSRGVVTAILWVTPSPIPYKVFGTRAEAIAWCRQMYDAAQSSAPPP